MKSSSYEVAIIGGGIAGSALAAVLGRDGHTTLLIERDLREPDRIVGELLQPGGINALHTLGLSPAVEGIDAVNIGGYRVFREGNDVRLPYPKDKVGDPFTGRGLHHGRFVMGLREEARNSPNVTVVQGTAKELLKEGDRVTGVQYAKGGEKVDVYADLIVIADGCFSNFRKAIVLRKPEAKSHFVGFIVKDMKLPSQGFGHIVLAHPAPVLIYPISSTDTRVLIDVPGDLPSGKENLRQHLRTTYMPQLPQGLREQVDDTLASCERIRSMPNSYLPSSPNRADGLIVLGDAANMRHPLTGGGMTVALNDVVTLRELMRKEANIVKVNEQWYWRRKDYSSVINVLAQALYAVFADDDERLQSMRAACFEYFKRGPIVVDDLTGMLGGIVHRPYLLLRHFFTVAWIACTMRLMETPVYTLPVALVSTCSILFKAAQIFVPLLVRELFL